MAPYFFSYLVSCFRRRSPQPDSPTERTRLLDGQPRIDVPPPRAPTIDHAALKDRLGTIVRAKESKMVNVNTPAPFGLAPRPTSPSASQSQSHSHSQSHSPARDSLPTSRSTSSLHPGDASYVPGAGARQPVFGARLVAARRGRSVVRGRAGRFGLGVESEGEGSREARARAEAAAAPGTETGESEVAQPVDISAESKDGAGKEGDAFRIHDVGCIAESWGD